MDKKIQIIKAKTFVLKPENKYLICLDTNAVRAEDAEELLQSLKIVGINAGVVLMINGDPNKVIKVIKDETSPS